MEKYIIHKINKNKNNPDIQNKFNSKEKERNEQYTVSKEIYNPITNIIPTNVKSNKDLVLTYDKNNVDINKLLIEKEKERNEQNNNCKPKCEKIICKTGDNIGSFDELKQQSNNNKNNKDNKEYANLLKDLKDLNIIS